MKKNILFTIIFVTLLIFAGLFFFVSKSQAPTSSNQSPVTSNQKISTSSNQQPITKSQETQNIKQTIDPISGALGRITKKPFGIFITPKTSPVQPERFAGYHNAVDLETTPAEQNVDVAVRALCNGKLLAARTSSGYGGVAVQSCILDVQAVTIIYGHIRLASMKVKVGGELKAGDFLANLAAGFSSQTDGERKHLHLGIRKGTGVNILGYVQNKGDLSGWLDPVKYLN